MANALQGRRIVVPESRELDLFVSMLERQGAEAIRCPMVTILDLEDTGPAEAWLRELAAGRFDDVVLFTGEGLRRLMPVAEKAGIAEAVTAGLAKARKVVRGPKPVKALRTLGLGPDLSAGEPTSAGVISALASLDLSGRHVGLQAYPGQGPEVDNALRAGGATVFRVTPYRYASHEDDARVAAVIDAMASGTVDAIAFTSRPQVKRLQEVAERRGLADALSRAMARTRIAAVGPVVGGAVQEAGWTVAVEPADNFHLKPLVATLQGLFGAGEARSGSGA